MESKSIKLVSVSLAWCDSMRRGSGGRRRGRALYKAVVCKACHEVTIPRMKMGAEN